jgi:hypothetical protein
MKITMHAVLEIHLNCGQEGDCAELIDCEEPQPSEDEEDLLVLLDSGEAEDFNALLSKNQERIEIIAEREILLFKDGCNRLELFTLSEAQLKALEE